MTKLAWDASGARLFETGVDRGVLYPIQSDGSFNKGVAWNGLTKVTEQPTGAAATPLWADNIKYLNLVSAEQFAATIEAYTYPDEFSACDGTYEPEVGVRVGQQNRKTFGFSYRTLVGNDVDGQDHGYKVHLVYGALSAPSQKDYQTVNDTPAAATFQWQISTTPVAVTGHKPTAHITIDSTAVSAAALANLENLLYGTAGADPQLPTPDQVLALFAGSVTQVDPVQPAYNAATHTITIPTVVGIDYYMDGVKQAAGPIVLTAGQTKIVRAQAQNGYTLNPNKDSDWEYDF